MTSASSRRKWPTTTSSFRCASPNLREALDKQPTIITYDNGGGQKGLRENPYLATYNKLVTRHADLCMKLVKLIPGEAEDVRDELEKFIGL